MRTMVIAALAAGAVMSWPQRASLALFSTPHAHRTSTASGEADIESEGLAVLDALVVLLRSGMPTGPAVQMATRDFRTGSGATSACWQRLASVAQAGEDVPAAWRELAEQWECKAFQDVAAAWWMSSRHGCPLAEAMATAAEGIRASRRYRAVVGSALAGAYATMTVLVLLPVLGVALGAALGADMLRRYSGVSGFLTLWPGLALMWLGRRWAKAMMNRVLTPAQERPA